MGRVGRPLRFGEALYALFVLGVAGGAFAWALLAWLTDEELRATLLACCGALLAVWSAVRLSTASRQP